MNSQALCGAYVTYTLQNASSVFLIHNHPSGKLEPSKEDIQVKDRLIQAYDLMGISVLDWCCETEMDGRMIKRYDRERTMCDLLFHRNKIDGEVFNTAVQRYIKDPERSTARLMQYAKELHVEKKVREVLGIWL